MQNTLAKHLKAGDVVLHNFAGLLVYVVIEEARGQRLLVSVEGQDTNKVWINA